MFWNAIDETDIQSALFGSVVASWLEGQPDSVRLERVRNGYWRPGTDPRGTRISAVLFGNNLRAWRANTGLPELWINPWATNPLTPLAAFTTVTVDDGDNFVRSSATKTAAEVFGLSPGWPNSQPD